MNFIKGIFSAITSFWRWFLGLSIKKKIITVIVIIVLLYFGYTRIRTTTQQQQYQTVQVERGPLVVSVSESGSVSVANRVSISTQTSGTINHVYVKNGDSVTQGEVLADLTLDTDGLTRQAQAYSSLLSAQNNLNTAKSKMNSLQSALFKANQAFLQDRGVSNPTDQQKADPVYIEENANWLQAESDYNNQSGVIAQAEAALGSASLTYNEVSSQITAPITGQISDIIIAPGMVITNSQSSSSNTISSQIVATVKHSGSPIISVSLSEIDVTKIKPGQRATITFDAIPDKSFTGKVLGIDTTGVVSSGVTSYPATIALDTEDDSIFPNMSATANIITNVKDNVLLVPTEAVITRGTTSSVYVRKNGQIESVDVTIGDSSDTQTEITSGLSEGDTVLIGYTPTQQASTTSPFSRNLFGGFGGGNARFGGGGGGTVRTTTGGR